LTFEPAYVLKNVRRRALSCAATAFFFFNAVTTYTIGPYYTLTVLHAVLSSSLAKVRNRPLLRCPTS